MKSKIAKIFILIIIVSFVMSGGCTSRENENIENVQSIKFEEADDSFRLTEYFDSIKCIQLEMTDSSVLGRIDRIVPAEDNLLVLSNKEVKLFGKTTGKYIRDIGTIGEGPEEYLMAQDIYYDRDNGEVGIYDRYRNEFAVYRLSGEFVRKDTPSENLVWMQSFERDIKGSMLTCNMLSPSIPPSDYAFTLIKSANEVENLDPFHPIFVKDHSATWAKRPLSKCDDEFKFVKMFCDTLFSVLDNMSKPLYKLEFDKKIPTKQTISTLGQYPGNPNYMDFCMRNNLLTGVDKMYETTEYIILVTHFPEMEGYYWVSKREGKGFHIPSTPRYDLEIKRVVEGKTIINIEGGNEKELVSCFDASMTKETFLKAILESGDNLALPKEIESDVKGFDSDGNPFLIIYSNE